MLTKFNLLADNPFWSQLQEAQSAHVKARDRYEDLLTLCKEAGVKFSDIQSYLLNQAKKVGLYRMSSKGKDGKPAFPTWGEVIRTNWGFALSGFLQYKGRTYKDYDVRVDKVIKVRKPSSPVTSLKVRKTAPDGKVTETRIDLEGAKSAKHALELLTPADKIVPEPLAPVVPSTAKPSEIVHSSPSIPPVSAGLSKAQIQAIIINNWSVLGEICREKGAVEEFNLLMDALGIEEEMIIEIPVTMESKYSSVAN